MPSMISNSAQFRPARWLAAVGLLAALAFAGGVLYGTSQTTTPQPAACTTTSR